MYIWPHQAQSDVVEKVLSMYKSGDMTAEMAENLLPEPLGNYIKENDLQMIKRMKTTESLSSEKSDKEFAA